MAKALHNRNRHDLACAINDEQSDLYVLKGHQVVLSDVLGFSEKWYKEHIDTSSVAYFLPTVPRYGVPQHAHDFPPPTGININMMPIKWNMIPPECSGYQAMIRACATLADLNLTWYLTIQESMVPVGQTQRIPGLHIDRPRSGHARGHGRVIKADQNDPEYLNVEWGAGHYYDAPMDGFYIGSNVDNTSKVWPVLIKNPEADGVTDVHGGIEHMRESLGEGVSLKANQICWLTDCTPHESLPVQAPDDDPDAEFVQRSFFRLVVGPVGIWYSKHSTANPLGIVPDKNTVICHDNKFDLHR